MKWLGCALALTACATTPRPAGGPETLSALVRTRLERCPARQTLRGIVTAETYTDGQRIKVQQVVAVRRPGSLRVETLSPFDQPISYLVVSDGRLRFFLLGEHRFWEGPATAEVLGRLFPLALPPGLLIRILLGDLPETGSHPAVGWDEKAAAYVVGKDLRVWVDGDNLGLRRVELVDPPAVLEIQRTQGDGLCPLPLRLALTMDDTLVRLRWDQLEVDIDLPEEAWVLEQPAGAVLEFLEPTP